MKIQIEYTPNSMKVSELQDEQDSQLELLHQAFLDMRNLKNFEFNHILIKFFQKRLMTVKITLDRFLGNDIISLEGFEKDIITLLAFFISQDGELPEDGPSVLDEGMSMKEMKEFWEYAFPIFPITIV